MRSVLLLVALAVAGGCVSGPGRSGRAFDRDRELVHDAIKEVARPSFDHNLRGAGWEAREFSSGSSSCAVGGSLLRGSRDDSWDVQFACRKPGAGPDDGWRLPASEYRSVLAPVRADVLAAVEKTGVEVTGAPEVEFTDGPSPEAKFVIRYLRTNRAVAGEVVGRLAPTDAGRGSQYSDLRITLREWCCK
ncbi:MAG: hypothetical protein J0I06_26230 [Planctomycetes bacterium]|nr:hypothetical protein [Planctomycetota bacterium]